MRRFRVIAYDISDDRRRARLEKIVLRYAARVQYSVFEGWLSDSETRALFDSARRFVRPPLDSLRVYLLCGACVDHVECLGDAREPSLPDDVVA